jgi:hypothetical protein
VPGRAELALEIDAAGRLEGTQSAEQSEDEPGNDDEH